MSSNRLSMQKIKDILRLKYQAHLSQRQISKSLGVSLGSVCEHLKRAQLAGLTWPLISEMSESELTQSLYGSRKKNNQFIQPDFKIIHKELKRKGVTLQLLWQEYTQTQGEQAYQYTQFCHYYNQWRQTLSKSMRQTHKAGEKCFVDYCGPTISVVNSHTSEIREAQIFVAVLGASNYTYAEATWTQNLFDWVGSHLNTFSFFGGVPHILVPDNLRSATKKPCRYEPKMNDSYQHMANYFGTAIIPARPYKPKDKAKAEAGVLLVERWILACLRHVTFFSLYELNQAIKSLLVKLNTKPFQKMEGSRQSQFELIDQPALKRLPKDPYHFTQFKKARVNIDYHMQFDKNYYSVPHYLCRLEVQVQATQSSVAIFYKSRQVAAHLRLQYKGSFATNPGHMPESHRAHSQWTPEKLIAWGASIGDSTRRLIQIMIQKKSHPEQAYRACLGLLNLSKKYECDRLNKACERALKINSPTYRSVKSILEKGLDQCLDSTEQIDEEYFNQLNNHDNIRGPEYYH